MISLNIEKNPEKFNMFAKYIRKLRQDKGYTQEFLASALDLSRPTYSQIEQGERDLTVTEAKKLAEIFGISLENFIEEKIPQILVKITKSKKTASAKESAIRIEIPQQKVEKFKQVLLYILQKVGGKPNVGMTVLYKLLYFIDFDYYEKYEEQLMGLAYIKNHFGPTPILFEKVIKQMLENGEIEKIKSKFYQHEQTKYLINPQVEPDLSILNGREKELIDWELQRLSELTAQRLSDFSHKDVPWISAEKGTQLDYEAVFYRTDETSVREYAGHED